jgi:hypothetical protein
MYCDAFTSISHAAVSDRLAGRLDLFFSCGCANGVFRAAYASSGGLSREPVTERSALDWNCLRYRIPDYFDAVFTLACGVGTTVRIPSYSALHHAGADVDFTIWYLAKDGGSSGLIARNKFSGSHRSRPGAVQCVARLVNASGGRSLTLRSNSRVLDGTTTFRQLMAGGASRE